MNSTRSFDSKVYRITHSVYLFFLVVLLVSLVPVDSSCAEDARRYADELVQTARNRMLARERYWEILMHYKPKGAGRQSFVDDPKFFLAPDGRVNPQAELEATLRGFFLDNSAGDEHPRCRFPARFDWLKEQLSIDESRLPPVTCAEFTAMYANINPQSTVLVFPAAHGNGPASMFGHTLLKIDGTNRSGLLSYAINYAAAANDTNGFVYAFKGIFGYYKGYFSLRPYYEKVSEYNDIEYRDIWEYELNLTKDETRKMVLHIWELKDIYSDYYFFDRNCSFDLLFLLEAARPSVQLTDAFRGGVRFWVIPSDTVRVIQQSGLIEKVKYRPSQATRILFIASRLDDQKQDEAIAVAERVITPQAVSEQNFPAEEKAKVLDLSAELLQYKYSRRQLEKDEYLTRFLATLKTRSTLGLPAASILDIPSPVQPDHGHLPGKLSIGAGDRSGSPYTEIGWRAAYHDLFDPDEGYVEGSQINFFDIRARYYFREEEARLQNFRLIDIVSLAPRDKFFKPVSWKVTTGFDQETMSDGRESLLYRVNPGGGFAWKTEFLGISYLMLETDMTVGDKLRNKYAIGIGMSAGFLKNVTDRWKIGLSVKGISYQLGDDHGSVKGAITQNFELTTNNSIALSLEQEQSFGYNRSDAKLSWCLYF